jgi:hypothetical protein
VRNAGKFMSQSIVKILDYPETLPFIVRTISVEEYTKLGSIPITLSAIATGVTPSSSKIQISFEIGLRLLLGRGDMTVYAKWRRI